MTASSSSSSGEEDWSKFADAAISVADVTSGFTKAAQQGKAKLEGKKLVKRTISTDPAVPGEAASELVAEDEDNSEELDGLALKIRDALDRKLEKLHSNFWADDVPSPVSTSEKKSKKKEKKSKKHKEKHSEESLPAPSSGDLAEEAAGPSTPAGAGSGGYSRVGVEDGWIAFFKGVKPGTPCILEKPEEEPAPRPRHTGWLPNRRLASTEKQALKRAAEVAVEGTALIAAANLPRKKIKQRLPLDGVVVEAKQHVPYDVRTARLLGMPTPACVTC